MHEWYNFQLKHFEYFIIFLCPMLSFSCQPQKIFFLYTKIQNLEKIKFFASYLFCCWFAPPTVSYYLPYSYYHIHHAGKKWNETRKKINHMNVRHYAILRHCLILEEDVEDIKKNECIKKINVIKTIRKTFSHK